ncbi:MAG: PAS domain S-box protein, partial [Desulfobulbaceae bacterium]|nr:PAS domain S-box protein [Desulfobulbaceae bacterium]
MKTKLIELIDFKKVDTLLDGFNKTTGFVTAILDLNGNVLSKSGWRQICTYFHPDNPETSKKCTISDTELAGKLTEGEKYHFYKCLSGLVDVAVPIVINGEHIANVFSGKFFFEEPNRSFFEQQAEEYGFDVKKYLKALDEVPIVSKEKVQITIDFLLNIIQLISETTLQKLEQTEANNALKESEERFQLLFNNAPLGYQSLDINGCFIEVNQQWLDMLGYTRDEVIGKWFGDFMTAESQILVKEKFPLFKAQGHIHSEFEMIHKNGSQLFIAFDGKIGYDLKGDFKQTHCILQDITQRRLAEEALIESETHFRTLANFGQALIWTSGTDKKCNYFNQPWLDFTGRTLEQEIGDGWVEGVHPDDLERCIEIYVSSFDRHEKFSMDYRLRHASGEYRWIQDDGTPRYNSKNEFIGYIGHCLDISGRKQAEEEIKQSQALSKTVIDSIPGTFYMINDRGKYIGWNAYQRDKIVGKQENQMLEMNAIDTIHPDDRQIVSEKIANVLKNGIEEVVEARVLLQGGPDFKWLLMTGTQMMVNGSPVLVGIGIDISERKKAQQTLLESEKRLKAITNYSASWEAWFNKDGRLVWTNSYCEKITGYTAEEYLAADNFLELAVSESDLSKVQNTLFNALTPTSGENLEIRCKRKERDEVWVSFSWVPIYDSDGNNIGIRTSASDLTQRRLAEEALNTANYELEKTELIAKIGGWSIDVKTMTPYLSRGVREIYEIDTELVLSVEEGIKFYIPEHRPVIEKAVQECMQSGTPYELELQIITAKGNKRW